MDQNEQQEIHKIHCSMSLKHQRDVSPSAVYHHNILWW